MSQFIPVLAANRSSNIRVDGQKVPSISQFLSSITEYPLNVQNGPVYVNIGDQDDNGGLPAWKEIANHIAIGQLLVVGPMTGSNTTVVVVSGGNVSAVASALEVDVLAGELQNRVTGAYTPIVANATLATPAIPSVAGQSRIDLVVVNDSTGVASIVEGTATSGTPVAPATPAGDTPLATYELTHTSTQPTNVTDTRPRP